MRKLILFFITILFLVACNKNEVKNISVKTILDEIEASYPIKNSLKEDLKNQNIAERYGLSPNDIEEGYVYYTKDEDKSDKIIIIKAKNKDKVESVERAISSEIIGMSDSWKENEEEAKKIDNHLFKTKDKYIIYCVTNNNEKIVEIFDNLLTI